MKLSELAGKKILIVGYGIEGRATEAFLRTHVPTATVLVADKQDGEGYLDNQNAYDIAIKSPGVPKELLTIPYTTATNVFFGTVRGTTIGVTGTKGKSTTASLIFSILKAAGKRVVLVGNIGTPMLAAYNPATDAETIYVCELSSYQLEDIEYSPHISVIINLYPEHMDRHGSVEAYWEAKKRIVAHATEKDYFVFHPDFPELTALADKTKAKAVPFVSDVPFEKKDIPLLGAHNIDNVRAAVTVGAILAIPPEVMHQGIRAFRPLPHRLELVGTFAGITFYDDAISTTPESTIKAMESVPTIGAMLLGGLDRGYDFSLLVAKLAEMQVPVVVLFPDTGAKLDALIKTHAGYTPRILATRDMKEAVAYVYAHAPKQSVCLLSCASPSYSIWKNFEEKGEQFQTYVKELAPAA